MLKNNFYQFVTELIDILEKNQVPVFDARCSTCNTAREIGKINS